ncbi:MAG: Deoxyguanosinetriphosphate triphosphohydrolase [Alphaproteobacteria bacterium ADurb.Bin438]|nr:MAG: Deoxyguanosinetriphosphate triphosphohydrolase [Alphaproteobacteria bacterium ADurb.Bin438]
MKNDLSVKQNLETMLSPIRLRESGAKRNEFDARNAFDSDYSRIVVSSYFRRLQDKAQVFPLAESDFLRTRLTHSLEVSTFARGIGLGVERHLIENGYLSEEKYGYIPSILSVSGLIHDIGNPPFGHSGEKSISNSFKKLTKKDSFSEIEKKDFENFDGNVQGFRILTKLSLSKDDYSYNLTCPTLASIIKYPYSSVEGNVKDKDNIFKKKFGFFNSEKSRYEDIINKLSLKQGQRHPLAYLLESADDIAYSVCDLEDGHRLRIISFDNIYNEFEKRGLKESLGDYKAYKENPDLYIQDLRIKFQSKMIKDSIKVFTDNIEKIVGGGFNKEIIEESESKEHREAFKTLGLLNFNHDSVLLREVIGDKVINNLMDIFYNTIKALRDGKPTGINKKEFSLVSVNIRNKNLYNKSIEELSDYECFMLTADYVSGMTDNFALNMYQKLNGMK